MITQGIWVSQKYASLGQRTQNVGNTCMYKVLNTSINRTV